MTALWLTPSCWPDGGQDRQRLAGRASTDHIRRCRTRSGGVAEWWTGRQFHVDAVDDTLLPCHTVLILRPPPLRSRAGRMEAFSWMMELAALVSALGVNLHRTKRGRRRTGFNGHGGPLGAWLLLFNILSSTCQTTIRNKRCSTAFLVCGYYHVVPRMQHRPA